MQVYLPNGETTDWYCTASTAKRLGKIAAAMQSQVGESDETAARDWVESNLADVVSDDALNVLTNLLAKEFSRHRQPTVVSAEAWKRLAIGLAKVHEPYVPQFPNDEVRRRTASGALLDEVYELERKERGGK